MSLLLNIKNVFALTAVLFLFTACGGGGGSASSTTATTVSTSPSTIETTTPTAKAVHSGQVKDSSTGDGLANVKVSLGESTTTTDENGFYTLSDLTASEEAVINFEKEGYLLGSTQIQLKALSGDNTTSPNYLEYSMHTNNYQWDYNSSDEIDGAHIMIDASVSYRDINGKPYSGTNTAELIYFDITSDEGKAVFPGAFKGINSNGTLVQFDTYGLISILLEDSNGNRLRLAEGETVALRFDKVSSLEKPDTLPLWYYDYEQGLWFEEGYAELQEDGTYKGEISHLGSWSLNRPLEDEAGIYRGRIINEDGSPMSDVRVHAVGENWIGSDLTTDENGMFEINVIPGSSFQLKAYDYKNKYGANYNGTIAAIASGKIVEE
ncbi:carboxypeptidase regulatory-like domain-containing protein [Sulfurovum sp. CS9]|uniref:carboxypeptidase regulatory-like domain-containing protein n=1 Tax=Sulfurovum sp. CS9 TaxID=3391146 RepID=UPI0039E79B60